MAITSSKIMLTLLVLMSIAAISLSAAAPSTSDESYANIKKDNADEHPLAESEQPSSFLVRNGRFLAQRVQAVSTCDVFPRLCLAKTSPGPDCCKKQCVNVMTDKLNCGKCGKRCKYSDMCCQGKCVNPSNDERHCGRCNNKCRNGGSCEYGLCSYA